MSVSRRDFILFIGASAAVAVVPGCVRGKGEVMYGLIGKIKAVAGQRDVLASILLGGISGMPGCLSYVVAKDLEDADALWITEVWDSQQSHQASLSLPSVQDAISKGKPLIAGFEQRVETAPLGGYGLG